MNEHSRFCKTTEKKMEKSEEKFIDCTRACSGNCLQRNHNSPRLHQIDEPKTTLKTCLSCGSVHECNSDGSPVNGALPCGH